MMSIETFCQRNGIRRQLAYNEMNAGRLEAVKVGRRTLISFEAEQRWRDSRPRWQARDFSKPRFTGLMAVV